MGVKTGDKGRHQRQRRKKLERRVEMRALRKRSEANKVEPPIAGGSATNGSAQKAQ